MNSKTFFLISCLLLSLSGFGQNSKTISGVIQAMDTEEPLVGASVYLNGTTLGNFSETDGSFELPYHPSFNQLVVSYLGYATITYNIQEGDWNRKLKILLEPEAEELNTVNISSTRTRTWKNNLYRFKSEFIGYSKFAKDTELLNPEVIYFEKDSKSKILKAFAREPLKIRNKALGYLIEYDLEAFQYQSSTGRMQVLGYSKFTKLEGSDAKNKKWTKNQQESYFGSFTHFIHTLQDDTLDESGYEIRLLKRILNPERPSDEVIQEAEITLRELMKENGALRIGASLDSLTSIVRKKRLPRAIAILDKNVYNPTPNIAIEYNRLKLSFENYWQISFKGEKPEQQYTGQGMSRKKAQVSIISLTTPEAVFDRYGIPEDPLSILFEGYWPYEKIPYLLPLDYIQGQSH